MNGFCPFCTGPVVSVGTYKEADGTPTSFSPTTCANDHQFYWADRLDAADTPRIRGWVYTNMQSATSLSSGHYLWRPDWNDSWGESAIGEELQDHWNGHEFRRCTVHWELNAPVPKLILERRMRDMENRMQRAAEKIGVFSAQMKEHYA